MRASALAATLDHEGEARPWRWRWQSGEAGPWDLHEQSPHVSAVLSTSAALLER